MKHLPYNPRSRRSRMERWLIGNLVFAVVPVAMAALAVPAAALAYAMPSPDDGPATERPPGHTDSASRAVNPESLPSRALIIDGRLVLAGEAPLSSQPSASEPTPSRGGTVTITAELLPSRLIAVDEDGRIVGIWSNTVGGASTAYVLTVRRQHPKGEAYPLTQEVLHQYEQLSDQVDWRVRGRVYAAGGQWVDHSGCYHPR